MRRTCTLTGGEWILLFQCSTTCWTLRTCTLLSSNNVSILPLFLPLWDLCDYADDLSVVTRAIQVDPSGIVPLLPLILRPNEEIPAEDGTRGTGAPGEVHIPVSCFISLDVEPHFTFRPLRPHSLRPRVFSQRTSL